MASLVNQVAVVTGAGRGLGRSTSLLLAKAGVKVVAISKTMDELTELANLIVKSGGEALSISADVSEPAQVLNAFKRIDAVYGKIDILINSAGIGVFGDLNELTYQNIQEAINVNLIGTILTSQEAYKRMKPNMKGHIINIVSSSGTKGRAKETIYAASKFGVQGFTLALQEEAKPYHIRVTSFRPGGINTTFWDKLRFYQPDTSNFMDVDEVAHFLVEVVISGDSLVIDDIALNRSRR